MRRVPKALWIFAPLAVGLLYAAGYALFAPRPTLANLPPEGAILVQRFRNLDEFDRLSFGPRGPTVPIPRETLGHERNLPGLPGVDVAGPLHMIQMPRSLYLDTTMAVFSVADGSVIEEEFNRPDFIERNLTRHAQHLVVRGPWAAVAPNRDDARRIGTGGITAADRGEDMALAADLPRLLSHALGVLREYPWRGVLEGLGADVDGARLVRDEATGALRPEVGGLERALRIVAAWREARMWTWMAEGRLQVELRPKPGPIADLLAHWHAQPPQEWPPRPPEAAEAWLAVPGGQADALLAQILHHGGLDVPPTLLPYAVPPDAAAAGRGGVLAWGEAALGHGDALALGLLRQGGPTPDVGASLPVPAGAGDERHGPLPAGAAPITAGSSAADAEAPAGEVWTRTWSDGTSLLTFGPAARAALERMKVHLEVAGALPAPESAEAGWRALAQFAVGGERAKRVLGRALEPGGFLACLAGGDLAGTLWTDGAQVRLDVRLRGAR